MKRLQITQTVSQALNTKAHVVIVKNTMREMLLKAAKKEYQGARRGDIQTIEYDETLSGAGEPFTIHVILMRIDID
jgi:hypothetical protein